MQALRQPKTTIDAETLIACCLDPADDAVWVIEPLGGRVVYANDRAAAWFAPDAFPRSAGACPLTDGCVLEVTMQAAAGGAWQVARGRLATVAAAKAAPERVRTLLVVDDEENILSALKRVLRRESYRTLTAGSGAEGLALLAANEVDVILSDQRMPVMTGVEFLRKAKERYPDTVRMVLSGYTDLQSVTDAINEGAIYKFLTKPWDDALLKANIEEAFRRKALHDENRQLAGELGRANDELTRVNAHLNEVLQAQRQRLEIDQSLIEVFQAALEVLPLPVVGVDEEGLVVLANGGARRELAAWAQVGACHHDIFPPALAQLSGLGGGGLKLAQDGREWDVKCSPLDGTGRLSGFLYAFLPRQT